MMALSDYVYFKERHRKWKSYLFLNCVSSTWVIEFEKKLIISSTIKAQGTTPLYQSGLGLDQILIFVTCREASCYFEHLILISLR